MTDYVLPKFTKPKPMKPNQVVLVTSGDLRLSANQECWPAQKEMEEKIKKVFKKEGHEIV